MCVRTITAKFRDESHAAICNGSRTRMIMRTKFRNDSDDYDASYDDCEISRLVSHRDWSRITMRTPLRNVSDRFDTWVTL